ncbi:hypothetical protein CSA56_05925 [candidate division KSB3 bacterium]|uniref:beta-N-acetylhexosaminidase n=1 Tax=candidate division KSB3 bacterium TaxID=2044937 RepID=A0A2G6KHA4_9BACT|nr:MAG: hypothetical protein CSA56_05925 [candidate division KSB3 bacterium]
MPRRGMEGGITAAKAGHPVVMTPTSHCYFDYYQSFDLASEPNAIGQNVLLPETVYDFEPVPPELSPEQAYYILGDQGNIWTEYIPTPEHLEYMTLPRMCALVEAV